jgi:hypothetical protein
LGAAASDVNLPHAIALDKHGSGADDDAVPRLYLAAGFGHNQGPHSAIGFCEGLRQWLAARP